MFLDPGWNQQLQNNVELQQARNGCVGHIYPQVLRGPNTFTCLSSSLAQPGIQETLAISSGLRYLLWQSGIFPPDGFR